MYQSMKAVGFVADRYTYQNLLLAAANGGDLARMKALIKEMEEEKITFDAVLC